jgi:hypothetical protein
MKIEKVEGSTVYTGLFTDENGVTWNFLIRSGGSISLYGTRPGESVHHVIFDTLDGQPPNETAQKILTRLAETAQGINLLISAAQALGYAPDSAGAAAAS